MSSPPVPSIEPLVLDQADPGDRGRAHGEHWRPEIRELAAIRFASCVREGGYRDAAALHELAARHDDVLRVHVPQLHAELHGIAEGAGVAADEILVLNHYTDLRDAAGVVAGDPGGCTAVYANGDDGPVLGQTWDMHASALPFVRSLRIAGHDGAPEAFVLTVTGCVGMAGINAAGVAVTINNLRTTDTALGVVWPALVRAMLAERTAAAARQRLLDAPLTGGHHYMIADGIDFFGLEASGRLKVQTQRGARAAHLHTNHCFDPVLRRCESVPRGSTTFARLNLATTVYAQQRPRDARGVWELLHTHDGTAGSLCIHPAAPQVGPCDPDPTITCAIMVMRLRDRWVRVVAGCEHRATAHELSLSPG